MNSCKPLFRKYNILPLPCQYLLDILTYIDKNRSLIPTNNQIHEHYTRNRHDYHNTKCNLTTRQRGPNYKGHKLFNMLPTEIKLATGNQFKNKLKQLLLDHCFYSVEEFLETRKMF